MTKPITRYTKSGRINIAYQVLGEGSIDLVYIPGWVSNIDLMWDCPQLANFFRELATMTRVILFDKRGTGLSDRISELSTLEERMDDIRAVMDAVQSERAILFGHSEGGSVSALFAATYPQRTISLVTFGVFAKRRYCEFYPWAPSKEERQKVYDMISNSWGSADKYLQSLAPSMADDEIFMDWLARYFRSGASPSAALVLTKMNTQVDIIDILDLIEVPTLLMYRSDDVDVKIEEGKFISERIRNSKFVEFPGVDHLFWAGDSRAVLDTIKEFVNATKSTRYFNRVLATILKIDIGSELSSSYAQMKSEKSDFDSEVNRIIEQKIRQYRGKLISDQVRLRTATFDGPSKAVHCAMDIRSSLKTMGISTIQGIHIGECLITDQKIKGKAVRIAEDILYHSKKGQINASNTVVNLLSGSGLEFKFDKSIRTLDNMVLKSLKLVHSLRAKSKVNSVGSDVASEAYSIRSHSFLENVLESIEINLENEQYSLYQLSNDIGVSVRHLQRKLKSITNKTPNQLIRSVRLHKAKELIIQKDKSVKEAAYATGFNSLSYFSTCFKKEFGQLPSTL